VDRLSTGRVVEYGISEAPDGVQVQTESLTQSEQAEVKEKVRWMFALDSDFSAFYKAARKEPKLRDAEKLARGRVLRSPTLFEDVVKTILTTNTLWGATKRMTLNLIHQFGEPLTTHSPERSHRKLAAQSKDETTETKRAFPTPQSIAASNPEVLKEKVRVGYRASAIHQLAVRTASGEFDLEALKSSSLPTLELRKELLTINGVGPYAAANLLLILGRSDFIPIDSWALKLVSHEWHDGKPVSAKDVEKHFEKWGEFKGFAFWFWDWKEQG
jgi:3-methyladenine DNA glycosylase/8-oxoguanine DNA glycosylase